MTSPAKPFTQKFVTVARILRARGNKGEVAAELLTDFPDRLKEQKEVFLAADSVAPRKAALQSFWVDRNHPGRCVFHFAEVSSISDAEKLRGLDVQIAWEHRAELPSSVYFVTDLIGCSVFELRADTAPVASSPCSLAESPTLLGQVRDVYFPGEGQPGTPLLVLDSAQGELLVPLAEDICKKIDLPARRIEVVLPEGLLDLNG
ncbi:MAG TPA: ribosome maturation factor RimM [Candidatus Acidoferrum sp.]|nr:ribosome maturation factor RimM [Candidatus Acidoferrum sp.]